MTNEFKTIEVRRVGEDGYLFVDKKNLYQGSAPHLELRGD